MKVEFRRSFLRDLQRFREREPLARLEGAIQEIERVSGIHEIRGLRKIRGEAHYYRIRIGDYRLGVRYMHRRDIYRYFP